MRAPPPLTPSLAHTPCAPASVQCLGAAVCPGTLLPKLGTSAVTLSKRGKGSQEAVEHLEAGPFCAVYV